MPGMTLPPDDSFDSPYVEADPTLVYLPEGASTDPDATGRTLSGAFRFALVVDRGPQAGLAFVLGEGITTAGRSDEAGIFLGDVTVSRDHARFRVDGEGLHVEDLGSTNGTYVNRTRTDRAALVPGDEVIIGKFHLIVTAGDA